MSEHTIKNQQPAPLPDQQKVAITLDTLDEIEHSIAYLKFEIKKNNDELRSLTNKINKLRLVLEAK